MAWQQRSSYLFSPFFTQKLQNKASSNRRPSSTWLFRTWYKPSRKSRAQRTTKITRVPVESVSCLELVWTRLLTLQEMAWSRLGDEGNLPNGVLSKSTTKKTQWRNRARFWAPWGSAILTRLSRYMKLRVRWFRRRGVSPRIPSRALKTCT